MNLIHNIYKIFANTVLDALFPLTQAEREIVAISPEQAFEALPKAPRYDMSVVPLPNTSSIFAYKDERVSKLVWNIKYKKDEHSASVGAFAIKQKLQNLDPIEFILIPMPVTERRRRERGYNQCEFLLEGLSNVEKDLLVRTQHKSRQTDKARGERLEAAKGIFSMNEEVVIKYPKSTILIVVDDVITTGSTMKEALDTLKSAGFTNVRGLSLAH